MGLQILLVEDGEVDVKITVRAVAKVAPDTRVTVARDGQACLDYVRRAGDYAGPADWVRPEVILLDLNMPRVDGFGVLAALKGDPAYRSIPIVILSASDNRGDVVRSYQSGANGFLKKPVDYDEFTRVMRIFVEYWQQILLPDGGL